MTRESDTQSLVRLAAAQSGAILFRNNVGVLMDVRGVPVRYGLANDSPACNKQYKSGDLIGIRPVLITREMVGTLIGQFWSVEIKAPGWRISLNNEREAAQQRWINLVLAYGGMAQFSTGEL